MAELTVIENPTAVKGLKECWKQRLQALEKELGSDAAPILEQLLIQQTALCWLKLNLMELSYSSVMKQSITLTLGMYWEKSLTAAQKRFARACETLARVRLILRVLASVQEKLKLLMQRWQRSGDGAYQIAEEHASLGEQDQAFGWLEKAYERRDLSLVNLKVTSEFDPLRSDPRFADLMRRVGLPQ